MLGRQWKKEPTKEKRRFVLTRKKVLYPYYYTVEQITALEVQGTKIYCHFCHQWANKEEATLSNGKFYCPHCISYGRITNQDQILRCPFPKNKKKQLQISCAWQGSLSLYQQKTVNDLLRLYQKEERMVLFAVTGAGKTEMLFPLLEQELQRGKRIAYVSPRVDVIKELYQRFSVAFPMIPIPILYGECHDYFLSEFVVCSIPQCIYFYQAFDLIIVDEADAFPFADNTLLHAMVDHACQPNGKILFMTATMNQELNTYPKCHLPLRYHLQPLPVPQFIFFPKKGWQKWYYQKKIKDQLKKTTRRILVFYPSIYQLEAEFLTWEKCFPDLNIACVHSKDQKRGEKIQDFYQEKYDLLLTTMILERGVTFSNIDVWVMHAEHPNFKREVLIQIAGRAGRKKDFATGNVIFWSEGETIAMQKAKKEIMDNNKKGEKLKHEMSIL